MILKAGLCYKKQMVKRELYFEWIEANIFWLIC